MQLTGAVIAYRTKSYIYTLLARSPATSRGRPRSTSTYAFQNAEVNVLWQLVGLVVAVVMGLVTAAVLAFVLESTIGLGVSEQVQVEGYDLHYWGVVHDEPTTAPSEPRPDQNGSRKASPVSGYRGQDHDNHSRSFQRNAIGSETKPVLPDSGRGRASPSSLGSRSRRASSGSATPRSVRAT